MSYFISFGLSYYLCISYLDTIYIMVYNTYVRLIHRSSLPSRNKKYMHTPINQCTSDCRRIGCPELKIEICLACYSEEIFTEYDRCPACSSYRHITKEIIENQLAFQSLTK